MLQRLVSGCQVAVAEWHDIVVDMLQQTLAQGLQGLLDHDGDVSEAFMQPFSIAVVDVFGVPQVHNLKENGDEIIVTNDTAQVR